MLTCASKQKYIIRALWCIKPSQPFTRFWNRAFMFKHCNCKFKSMQAYRNVTVWRHSCGFARCRNCWSWVLQLRWTSTLQACQCPGWYYSIIPALILLTNSYCRRRNTAPLLCRRPEFKSPTSGSFPNPPLCFLSCLICPLIMKTKINL